MSSLQACSPFDQQLESIQEFFQRFNCQMSEALHKVRNDDLKKAKLLIRYLPVAVISELQRRIAPALLTDATFDVIEEHLLQQFSASKSTVGASVQFLTYRQQSGQSLEEYSRKLNSLASVCDYPSDCLDRLLRDAFVAGLNSPAILSTLIQECDKLTFRDTVERAKLLQTFRSDADKIHSSRVHATSEEIVCGEVNKIGHKKTSQTCPRSSYLCYRCGVKGQHFSNNCEAIGKVCRKCNKTGHLARICQQKSSSSQRTVHHMSSRASSPHSEDTYTAQDDVHALKHTECVRFKQSRCCAPIGCGSATPPTTPSLTTAGRPCCSHATSHAQQRNSLSSDITNACDNSFLG